MKIKLTKLMKGEKSDDKMFAIIIKPFLLLFIS